MKIKGTWIVEKLINVLKEVDQKAEVNFEVDVADYIISKEDTSIQENIANESIQQIQKANINFLEGVIEDCLTIPFCNECRHRKYCKNIKQYTGKHLDIIDYEKVQEIASKLAKKRIVIENEVKNNI